MVVVILFFIPGFILKLSIWLNQESGNLFLKGQLVNILGFPASGSLSSLLSYHHSWKAALDHMQITGVTMFQQNYKNWRQANPSSQALA